MSEEQRTCLECNEPIKGRADKKFCSDGCRNAYNNREFRDVNNLIRNTNRVLSKNRKILVEMNPTGKTKTTRDILVGKGFNFDYFTSIYETKKGGRYYFCYDQGYIFLDAQSIALVKKLEDLNNH
ncbi:hypothetical protein Oweho_0236 [Owenweeksia hongkongensis DSM 17368]|uniref:DUF2116 family Zn-ribbon domain-containing protein n=1 Tax=Owenweeksia hongkongensis (strain DSM 17368 / CIP 108786 / JCM 12287 / NRRL B-23963 / UST20020801) TaxID=926562 RepID=G8R7E7_OWEHD|nr:hypothetical protein [Owenweeksia hongkongensis]AEV31258.1 hypothetical protein Oweho_0236 [Owenweeksia hongkongensis DSM 17368]